MPYRIARIDVHKKMQDVVVADAEVDGRCESGGFARWLTRAGEERPRKLSRVVERQAVAVLLNRVETPRVTVMIRRHAKERRVDHLVQKSAVVRITARGVDQHEFRYVFDHVRDLVRRP